MPTNAGSRATCASPEPSGSCRWSTPRSGTSKGWLNGTHQGVGRPHLQAYLDEFVFRHNRRGNLEAAFQTLLGLGSKHAPVRTNTTLGAQDLPYFRYPHENPQPVLEG